MVVVPVVNELHRDLDLSLLCICGGRGSWMQESGWGTCSQSVMCHFVVRIFFYELETSFIRISSFKQCLVVWNKTSLLQNLACQVVALYSRSF